MISHLTSCLIIKNEQENIISLVRSLLKFSDEVFIIDTGSTDSSIDLLKGEFGNDNRVTLDYFEWNDNFSDARNYAFSRKSKFNNPEDYFFWCDGDEIVSDDLAESILELKENHFYNLSSIFLNFYFKLHNSYMLRNAIIRKHDFTGWEGVIHETPTFNVSNKWRVLDIESGFMQHTERNPNKDYFRNVKIYFNKELREGIESFSLRDLFYYGFEHYQLERFNDAKRIFDILLSKGTDIKNKDWESYYFTTAISCIAKNLIQYNQLEEAFKYLCQYIKYGNALRADTAYYLGLYFREVRMFEKAKFFLEYAKDFKYEDSFDNTFSNELYYNQKSLELLLNVYWCLEDNQSSYNAYKELCEKYPDSELIEMNKDFYNQLLNEEKVK